MIFSCIKSGAYQTNCYIIGDEATNQVALVDVGQDARPALKAIAENGYDLQFIFVTHGHFDHTDALADVLKIYNPTVVASARDLDIMKNPELVNSFANEGDVFELGSLRITAISTPGHTKGGTCYLCGDLLFSGDTLFHGDIGRTDMYGGNYDELIKSIRTKLLPLDGKIKVLPGHESFSTIEEERRSNPYV